LDTSNWQGSVDEVGEEIRPQIEQAKRKLGQLSDRITTFIEDHPVASILGALTLGFLVARVARRRQS
jgi:hypothetical protein